MLKALANATAFTGRGKIDGKAILIRNEKIESFIDNDKIPAGAEITDCSGKFIAPGLMDLQIAGGGGYLFQAKPSAEALDAITASIVNSGTTGFLVAISTESPEVYKRVLKAAREYHHHAFMGLHFEGPYLSIQRKGAHMQEYIRSPRLDELKALLDEADGVIKMMTLAPEVCNYEIIEFLNDNGIVVAAGHSNATFRQAVKGFEQGIRTTTHLFNGMSQFHHRDPGLPGAAMLDKKANASIIADGIHVDYNVVSIAKKLMNERLFLVSDAVEENSTGWYQHVRQEDRFTLPDGTLSGSKLSMLLAVRNCVEHVDIPQDEALRMASAYPARLMKMDDRGILAAGFSADLVVFDKNYKPEAVMVNGKFEVNRLTQ